MKGYHNQDHVSAVLLLLFPLKISKQNAKVAEYQEMLVHYSAEIQSKVDEENSMELLFAPLESSVPTDCLRRV
jgi:hypothetical protein